MSCEQQNLNFNEYTDLELIVLVRKYSLLVNQISEEVVSRFQNKTSETSPCNTCSQKDSCKEPCDALEAFLPRKDGGRGYKEIFINTKLENLEDVNTKQQWNGIYNQQIIKNTNSVSGPEAFEKYHNCWDILTHKQREIVHLYYLVGMTQKEIAEKINKKRSTVSDILRRARIKKEKYERKLRAEKYNLLKSQMTE